MTHARERLIALARPSTRFSVRLSIRTVVVFSMPIFKENTSGHIRSATGRPSRKIKRANKARLLRRGRGCLRWWRRLCHVQRRGTIELLEAEIAQRVHRFAPAGCRVVLGPLCRFAGDWRGRRLDADLRELDLAELLAVFAYQRDFERGVVQSERLCARHRIGDDRFALQIAELIE